MWNVECGHAVHYFAHRSQRNTDASGVLANNADCAIGAADEHGFFADGVQLICGDRGDLWETTTAPPYPIARRSV